MSDDLVLNRSRQREEQDAWVRRVLAQNVPLPDDATGRMAAMGVDVPTSTEDHRALISRQAAGMVQTLAVRLSGAPELAAARAALGVVAEELRAPNLRVSAARTALAQAQTAIDAGLDRLAAEHAQLMQDERGLALPADADPQADAAALTTLGQHRQTMQAALTGGPPTQASVTAAAGARDAFRAATALLAQTVAKRLADQRDAMLRTADEAIAGLGPDAVDADILAPAQAARRELASALPVGALSVAVIVAAQQQARDVTTAVATAALAITALRQRRAALAVRVAAAAEALGKIPGNDSPEAAKAALSQQAAAGGLAQALLTKAALDDAVGLIQTAETDIDAAARVVAALVERQRLLGERLARATTPPDTVAETAADVQELRRLAGEAMAVRLSALGLDAAEQRIKALEDAVADAAQEVIDLGGALAIAALANEFGSAAAARAAFGGTGPLRQLTKSLDGAKLAALAKTLGANDMTAGATVITGLASAYPPAELPALEKQIPGKGLAALLAKQGSGASVKTLCDNLGAGFVGALMGAHADANAPADVAAVFSGNFAGLQNLAKDSGLDKKPSALAALLTRGCKGNAASFAALAGGFATPGDAVPLKALVEGGGLGDLPDCLGDLVGVGCGGDAARLKQLGAAFADPGDQAALKRAAATGGLGGKTGGGGEVLIDPSCLGMVLRDGAKETTLPADFATKVAALKTLVGGLDGTACANLSGLLENGGLGTAPDLLGHVVGLGCAGDPAKLAALADTLRGDASRAALKGMIGSGGLATKTDTGQATGVNAECLGRLLGEGCDGKPDEFDKLGKAFAGNFAGLKNLAHDSGLDRKPQALAAILKRGCKGDAAKFATLAGGFPNGGDAAALKGLVEDAGLGDLPEALGELVGVGCASDPANLKALATAFGDGPSRTALKDAATAGGLGGKKDGAGKVVIDPSCLGMVLRDGAKETNPTADFAAKVASLKTLVGGLDGTSRGDLAGLLENGGLGTAPDLVGHMVGLGCDGDPAKLATLGAAFTGADSRTGLKKMIESGGFAAKTDTGADTRVKAECLGRLLGTGCDGKPAELDKLVKALDDPSRAAMQEVMRAGKLGDKPKVLARLYQQGCLNDPNGANDGAKKPQVLKDMMLEFGTAKDAQGPAKFNAMLTTGGMGDVENRLGDVVRHAFTPKYGGAAKVQDAKKLKDLCDQFSGNSVDPGGGGATPNMPKLKLVLDALDNTAPDIGEPGEPGKGLQNVFQAAGVPVNQARSIFYARLKQADVTPLVGVLPPPKLTFAKLVQNAASFEFQPVTVHVEQVPNPSGGNYDVDTAHIANRHTRKFNTCVPPPGGEPTTLFAKSVHDVDLLAKVISAVGDASTHAPADTPPYGVRNDGYARANPPGHPPADQFDLSANDKRQYRGCDIGGGLTATLGFKPTGNYVVDHGGAYYKRVMIGQMYPEPNAALTSIRAEDLNLIRQAMNH